MIDIILSSSHHLLFQTTTNLLYSSILLETTMLLPEFEIHYKLIEKLGQGGFGDVYKCIQRATGRVYAAKIIENVTRLSVCHRTNTYIPTEVALWRDLRHPNVIRYLEHFNENGVWVIVMEYLSGYQDLYDYMRRKDKKFDEIRAASIISQAISAVNYFKTQCIDHRDLKLENILYNNKTKQIKIIDFGCASRITVSAYTTIQGTQMYYPPEWFAKRSFYSSQGTVWAVGTLAYILLNGCSPFPWKADQHPTERTFKKLKWRNDSISSIGKKFIKRCLRAKSYERYSLEDMSTAKWLTLSNFV